MTLCIGVLFDYTHIGTTCCGSYYFSCSVKKSRQNMGWVIIVYMVILLLELSLGCSFIVWKCVTRSELECKLAIGGTILSVAIWMLVVLVCPCFMSPCEICDVFDNVAEKCFHYFGKLQTKTNYEVYVHNEVYFPTTISLLSNGHDDSLSNSEDNIELLHQSLLKENSVLEQVDTLAVQSEKEETSITVVDKRIKEEINRPDKQRVSFTNDVHVLSD